MRFEEIGHAERGHVWHQGRRVELVGLRVDRTRQQLEFYGGFLLQMMQRMQQRERILAAGQTQQDAVAVADHAVVADGAARLGEQ